MTEERAPIRVSFIGFRDEQEDFARRHARFLEVLPNLEEAMKDVCLRRYTPPDQAHLVVFLLGRLVVEDFLEILLNCGNGYGMAALKLLRPMFETAVTAMYLARHPADAPHFLEYHVVHQRKTIMLARGAGLDLRKRFSDEEQAAIEVAFQAIKGRYRQAVCEECGAVGDVLSWTKKDPITMAREVGLERMVLGLYFLPMLHIHTTPTRLMARLRETEDGLVFRAEPQRREADAALRGAHICLAVLLTDLEKFFELGVADLEGRLQRDIKHSYPGAGAD